MRDRRRELLKVLSLGGGAVAVTRLPATWSSPVVDAVTLPAHAVTSGPVLSGSTVVQQITDAHGSGRLPAFFLIDDAVAGGGGVSIEITLFAFCQAVGNDQVRVQVLESEFREGNVDSGNGNGFEGFAGDGETGTRFDLVGLLVQDAHAPPPLLSCYHQHLHEFVLPLTKSASGDYRSPVVALGEPTASCGHDPLSCAVAIERAIQVVVDHPAFPSTGTLLVSGGDGVELDLSGGGSPLAADCFGMACEVLVSDRSVKEGFDEVDVDAVLEQVAAMPVSYWSYTDRDPGVRHIGPMAQDFHQSFGVGDSDRHIHVVDANGVNLASIQALYRRLQEKDARIDRLESELAAIKDRLGLSG